MLLLFGGGGGGHTKTKNSWKSSQMCLLVAEGEKINTTLWDQISVIMLCVFMSLVKYLRAGVKVKRPA